jgi:hypothetical protein
MAPAVLVHYNVYSFKISMFAVVHSDFNSLKSGLLHLTGQPYCIEGRSVKVKDGVINLSLRNYLID